MSTLSVTYASNVSVVETFGGSYISSADNTATTNGLSESGTLTASTSVPVTKHAAFQQALTAGAATIDLTALTGINSDEVVDLTGLKPQIVKFRNLSTNTNVITIAEGASNGHALLGASFSFKLLPGQSVIILGNEAAPDVAGADKTWDITGTGSQVLEVHIVAG